MTLNLEDTDIQKIAAATVELLKSQLLHEEPEQAVPTDEACIKLRCTPQTLNNYKRKNQIKWEKIGGKNFYFLSSLIHKGFERNNSLMK